MWGGAYHCADLDESSCCKALLWCLQAPPSPTSDRTPSASLSPLHERRNRKKIRARQCLFPQGHCCHCVFNIQWCVWNYVCVRTVTCFLTPSNDSKNILLKGIFFLTVWEHIQTASVQHNDSFTVISWISWRSHHKVIRHMTLTLLKSRYQLVDNVLHCSVMAKKNKRIISYLVSLWGLTLWANSIWILHPKNRTCKMRCTWQSYIIFNSCSQPGGLNLIKESQM